MDPFDEVSERRMTRRHFFGRVGDRPRRRGAGSLSTDRMACAAAAATPSSRSQRRAARPAAFRAQGQAGHLPVPVRRAVADRSVRLQAEARQTHRGSELPDSIRKGQRLTGMTSGQKRFPSRRRSSSSRSTARAARGSANCCRTRRRSPTSSASSSRCTPRRSITIRPITFFQTGIQLAGRPSIGAWLSYGLGSENQDLPAFVVMISARAVRPISRSTTGSGAAGFLPSKYQGVKFRAGGDPVLYLSNPDGHRPRSRADASRRPRRS